MNEVTPALFAAGPDPAAMTALAEATILGHIRQLGLARTKARHLKRLAQRWGLSSGENVTRTETDLKRLFPRESWNRLHLQIIFYGREHCTARGCDGTVCPLCRELYPNRRRPLLTSKA